MSWNLTNGGSTLSVTFTDLLTGATGFEYLLDLTPAVGSSVDITVDFQQFVAAQSMNVDELAIPVAVGNPPTRKNVVVRVGDVIRMRKSGGTATVSWAGTVRTV
jgi:hypothetical protein